MNKSVYFIQAITLILTGSLLQVCGNIGGGWPATLITIAGFVIYFVGLGQLKKGFDETGKKAIGMLEISAIIGIVGGFLNLIPFIGIFAGLLFAVSFILELIGFLQLKNTSLLGPTAKSGVSQMVVASILALVGALFSIIPFLGHYVAIFFYFISLGLIISGWLRIQKDIIQQEIAEHVSFAKQ